MNLISAEEFLATRGFSAPNLAVLAPNINEYSLFASQPKGEIRVSEAGIGNLSQEDAIHRNTGLLRLAAIDRVDLLITPEYSLPWAALINSILAGYGPAEGCLWVLGCESITAAELENLQTHFGGRATVLYEPVDQLPTRAKRFLDPLAYVFSTVNAAGQQSTVILIQFKTHPSVDEGHIEIDHLILGSQVYIFGTIGSTVRLASLICSDVLALADEQIIALYVATLIVHIQLNPKPRESAYRTYRKQLFVYADHATELICVNWAANISSWHDEGDTPLAWNNIGGSAWYLRPKKFDSSDLQVTTNHRRGLYYTWHSVFKCHILFFNYEPGIYCFVATKVWHHGVPQVQSKQTGPRLKSVLKWNEKISDWTAALTSNDGFAASISAWADELANLVQVYELCPVATERLIALVQGSAYSTEWHSVKELPSFVVDESENVRRITFAQETEPTCVELREAQIQHFVTAQQAFKEFTDWPPELQDLKIGWQFAWVTQHLHCNVVSTAGKYATVVYCRDNVADHRLRKIGDALREWLIRAGDSPNRLAILFRKHNQLRVWRHPESRRYDKPAGESPANFTEAS